MGYSMLQTQTESFDKLNKWAQENNFKVFFEFNHDGKDYGTKETPDVEMEVYEQSPENPKEYYRRGTVLIKPSGYIVNRSYVKFPE